jgi:hypothetical protein
MYGRPFGKSLCHAWGASPIYLLGKYYLGVNQQVQLMSNMRLLLSLVVWLDGRKRPNPKR